MIAQSLTLKGLLLKPSHVSGGSAIQHDEVDEVPVSWIAACRLSTDVTP
jgi:hypothetical protein